MSPTEPSKPLLSVIVPVYNSSRELERCLAALKASQFDDIHVLVVDDGSTEPIEGTVTRHGFDYLRIDGPRGPARARNCGALQSNGKYLVFIDADVLVHPDTLMRIAEAFAGDPGIDGVIGSYDDDPGDPGFLSQYKNIFHHYVHHRSHGDVPTFWSGCGAMRRSVFLEFGGFDEVRYGRPAIEDIELGTWLTSAGRRIILDNRVKCRHLKRWTFLGLLKADILDRGIPWVRLMLRAGEVVNTLNVTYSQRLSVVLVHLTPVALLAALWSPWALILVAGLVLAVTALNLDFYRYFADRRGLWFAVRVVPLHWLYFVYCGLCVVAGTVLHYFSGDAPGHLRRPLSDCTGGQKG
ncbi:MAG TPA: glycosyltransferase [Rhodothermales bacterium]